MEMAQKYREELVGKRFLSVSAVQKLNISKVSEWGWKAGVIRAASHKDNKDKELQVLVEYDGESWRRRQWITVYSSKFHTFMVENILVLADRVIDGIRKQWAGLSFKALIPCKMENRPVEFLNDRQLAFLDESEIEAYKDSEATGESAIAARRWNRRQQAQRVLLQSPAALRGCRAQVYRARGATQWYTAVIVGCNAETGELTVTDDTVLEEHNEDPSLVQMRLLGDGVVESIMRGESVGIMPRRSRSGALLAKEVNQVSRVKSRNAAKNNKNHRSSRLLAAEPPDTEKEEKSVRKKRRRIKVSAEEEQVEVQAEVQAQEQKPEPEPEREREQEQGREPEAAEEAEGAESEAAEAAAAVAPVGAGAVAVGRDVGQAVGSSGGNGNGPGAKMEDASRFPDDRSDSGLSSLCSLRSASGDERPGSRSGSRSSALSAAEDMRPAAPSPAPSPHHYPPPHATHHPHPPHLPQHHPHLLPPLPALPAMPPGLYPPPQPDLLWPNRYPDDYLERDRILRNQHITRATYSDADLRAAPDQRLWHRGREREVREQIESQQLKEREKERDRIEREREREREREKQEREQLERERQEKAVHKHFEDSLRLARQKRERTISWNLINSLTPQARGAIVPNEHERASAADRLRNESRDQRPYYAPSQVQRPPSVPKNEYPPPAHSRMSLTQKSHEKAPVHVGLPKAEPNFNIQYNYSGYHHPAAYANHEIKHKTEHVPQPQLHNNISASKVSGVVHERERDGPPSTSPHQINELKNSVIVKHEGKIPHYPPEAKAHAHPGHSPKMRADDVPCRYVHVSQSQGIEYRNAPPPPQAAQRGRPHHHSPAPVPSRIAVQPQHAPLQPNQQQPDRYGRQHPAAGYAYHSQMPPAAAPPPAPSKPKVSSPAPPHIYGKPNAGITSGIPVCRAQEPVVPVNPIPLTSKVNPANCYSSARPPPAHWRGNARSVLPRGASPPPAAHPAAAPPPLAYQTQPLDLGVSSERDENDRSPKRRGTPVMNVSENAVDFKKRRTDSAPSPAYRTDPAAQQYPHVNNSSPLLSRVSEPTPLIASAATTITTMVNTAAYCTSPAPRAITDSPVRIPSADGAVRPPSVPDDKSRESEAISPLSLSAQCPSPLPTATPVKVVSPAPSGSPKDGSAPVRHLKKAWLQRHEKAPESEQESPGGSSVTLPLVTRPSDALSLNNVGSMAVNSIIRNKSMKISRKSNQKEINGHGGGDDSRKLEDSSSSDQERSTKSPPKRKPPKVKRKKGGGPRKAALDDIKKKKNSVLSDSGSDSDKESNSDKDSDSGASLNHSSAVKRTANGGNGTSASAKEPKDPKEPRKRGRRPKTSKSDKTGDDEPIRNKKSKDDPPPGAPFNKPPISQLKKTGESFLQDGACCDVAPKLAKCRECRWTPHQRSKNMPNIFCRFYAFRRLRYTKNGQLAMAGFSDPNKDPSEEDKKLWLQSCGAKDLDIEMSCFLLRQIGDQFCELLQQEREAKTHNLNEDKTIAWKRVVQGVREMCDVCETTLFNFHWACGKCGFVVCLDCYKSRAQGGRKVWNTGGSAARERDDHGWLTCTSRAPHEQAKLMPTQIAAGDALARVGKRAHITSALWGVPRHCRCPPPPPASPNAMKACRSLLCDAIAGNLKKIKDTQDEVTSNGVTDESEKIKNNGSSLSWLADVSIKNEDKRTNEDSSSSDSDGDENYSTLRELLIRPSNKPGSGGDSPTNGTNNKVSKKSRLDILDDVISSVNENKDDDRENDMDVKSFELKHFVRRYNRSTTSGKDQLPIRIMTLLESKVLYPDTPHSWLCDGKLLRLHDPTNPGNYKIFQDQWKRGQPVIVSDVLKHMDKDLWTPESFARDFGEEKNDLINCITGNIVPNQPMKKFWEGFDHTSRRLKDEHGDPMLLKLKDWPPGEDFSELLPARFSDLMKNLPMQDYTIRSGRLNLASRLPECFVRPDLGPKMYTAYGSALHPGHGTTNLHLDVSDAVNIMVYVSGPKDVGERITREAFRAIDEAGCDILTRRRVRERGEIPGALWHIYSPRDADKIRDLLNKTAIEKGAHPQPHHDPIHDQSCYLDTALRERLYKEYRVEGYAVAQCLGDAVFIPAGAPHQVRNLHDCIKVAEDFVSPENVSHCFHLTQEFRDLSDTHTNHEDKLQIKNIIYHAVKDSLDCLKRAAAVAENRGDSDSSKDDIKMET